MGDSPASEGIRALDEWQMGLIYETAMRYPIEALRRGFAERERSTAAFDDADLIEMGYSGEEIVAIKGKG
ncbi:MAG: hypothetical protein FWE09_00055 [Treponema sp.]|nr:hypothetical protein [Treponema sp.]